LIILIYNCDLNKLLNKKVVDWLKVRIFLFYTLQIISLNKYLYNQRELILFLNMNLIYRVYVCVCVCVYHGSLLKRADAQWLCIRLLCGNPNYRLNKRWSSTKLYYLKSYPKIQRHSVRLADSNWRWSTSINTNITFKYIWTRMLARLR